MEKAPRLRGWASPLIHPTSLFIRDYLLSHGEGYAQEVWRDLKKARGGLHVCTYDSFKRNYIYILKKLGLIEPTRTEVAVDRDGEPHPEWYRRKYYRIVPGREGLTDEWTNPQKVWKLKRYGYYKRKITRP